MKHNCNVSVTVRVLSWLLSKAKEKERKQQNPIGLATQDSSVSTPYVEARSLAAYAAFEGGDFE